MELLIVTIGLSVFYLIIWNWFLNSEDEELKWWIFWWWLFSNDDEDE